MSTLVFATLSRKGRQQSHIKQSSFDVAELAAAGRLNNSNSSDMTSKLSPLRQFKRLSQFFKRQSSDSAAPFTSSNQSITSSSGKDQIFGRPLDEICLPEPPKPVMDLLIFLQEVGPFTREIFRKPPNARRCRLLVDKLNSSEFQWDVDESCNGLLLAAVFKTFLREVPNKLCDDRLYNQWEAIIQETGPDNHKEKVTQIKRLIACLPETNQRLLKYTICVLYRIQQRAMENLMTSYNLSVCLGPCLLWTTSTNCRDVEKASKTVPKLVEYVIVNCIEIFGKDFLSTLRVSDTTLARNTSMSLDSVFTDRPPRYLDSHSMDTLTDQLGRQKMSPSRLSYDSGMILDDASHDGESTNENKPSEPTCIHKRFNVSYDSLDCDAYVSDEDIPDCRGKLNNNNSLYVNTSELSPHIRRSKADDSSKYNTITSSTRHGNTYQSRLITTNIHKRNTINCGYRTLRPTSTPPPLLERKPSVSYDKITYRYITEPQSVPPTTASKYYSLPRPTVKSRPALGMLLDSEHQLTHQAKKSQLTSVTCGQSPWKATDVPMIIVDKCQQEANNSKNRKEHVTRLQILPKYHKTPDYHRMVTQQLDYTSSRNNDIDIPIYENSELYGPSTLNRQRPRKAVESVPLYENLGFHRNQPIIRPKRRSLATTNSYSTYRQKTYHSRPGLLPLLEQRGGATSRPAPPPMHGRTQSHYVRQAALQETCYFV